MKNKNLEKIGGNLFKIFALTAISILCLVMFYASIKFGYNYFTKTDEQICQISNSTLINGQCHSECNRPVKEQRDMLLIGGIVLSIFAVLLIFYLRILLKTKFKKIK